MFSGCPVPDEYTQSLSAPPSHPICYSMSKKPCPFFIVGILRKLENTPWTHSYVAAPCARCRFAFTGQICFSKPSSYSRSYISYFFAFVVQKTHYFIAESEGLVCPYYQNNNSCELRLNMYFIMALLIIPKS